MTPRLLQFACGAAVVLFGAYLIGRWALGIAIVLIGLFLLMDGLLRHVPMQPPQAEELREKSVEEILDRARRFG